MLAYLLLYLWLAFVVGGLRHGTQTFAKTRARDNCVLGTLATAAVVIPSLAKYTHTPAEPHVRALSDAAAVVLLLVFVLSLPAALRRSPADGTQVADAGGTAEGGAAEGGAAAAAPG